MKLRYSLTLFALALMLPVAACSSGETETRSNSAASATPSPAASQPSPTASPIADAGARAKVNLNTTAEKDFLIAVPNLPSKMAHEFVEYRPYRSVQQFRREIGKYVKPEQVAEYEKYVYVPININEADAATLQQIPGIDASEAAALIAARPYADADAFNAKLGGLVSETEAAIAKSYIATP
jgi:DNA uptake protein ComE-like DNA-binding protein